jgi:hypothetical protein
MMRITTPPTTTPATPPHHEEDAEADEDANANTTVFENICERLRKNDPTLTTISLPYSALSSPSATATDTDGMTVLATALLQSTCRIHTLELVSARPDAAAAATLAATVQCHPTLHTLKLVNCQSNGLLPILLFQALQWCPPRTHERKHGQRRRQHSHVMANAKDATGATAAATDADVTTATTTTVPPYSRLRVLELSGDSIDIVAAGALQSLLQTNRHLRKLKLADMNLDDKVERAILLGLQYVSGASSGQSSSSLQVLSLVNCNITDAFCVGFAEAVSASTTSTTIATQHRPFSGLLELDLKRNRITDTGAVALANVLAHTHLVKLSLAWNRWTVHTGLQAFCERLPEYTRLQTLDLYHADLYVPLAFYDLVVDGMETNTCLQSLSMACVDESSSSSGSLGSESDMDYEQQQQKQRETVCPVLQELSFLWQEPEYSEAARRLSFLLHLNKSGRRHLTVHAVVAAAAAGNGNDAGNSDNDGHDNKQEQDRTLPGDAVWPEILCKFGKHADQGASGIFHLLQSRPGNFFWNR